MGCVSPRITPLVRQLWTVSGVLLSILSQGMAQGFMSVLLTALKKPDSPIKMDIHLASWLASGMAMSVIIGILTATILMELFGRKVAYILEVVPGVTAMLLVYCASDFGMLMAARLLDGVTAGGTVILGAVIIGEYVSPEYRGILLNLKTAFICLGSTIVHSLGYYLHWKTVALIALIPYSIALLIIFTWKESPSWLATKNRIDESKESFLWLRGNTTKTRAELNDFLNAQEERVSSQLKSNLVAKIRTFFKRLRRKDFLQPVLIMICSTALLEVSGRHLVPVYAAEIVGGIMGNHGQTFYYTLAIDLIVTISATCSSILIKLTKTRTLLFCSGLFSLLILSCGCLYLFLASQEIISNNKPLIPLGLFILYFVVVNLGCTTVPLALIGEIMPLEHKSYGIFAFSVIGCLLVVVMVKVFPYLLFYIDISGAFFVLGVVAAIMLIILYFILPETKNRTLQEIEDCLKFGKVQNRSGRDEESTNVGLG